MFPILSCLLPITRFASREKPHSQTKTDSCFPYRLRPKPYHGSSASSRPFHQPNEQRQAPAFLLIWSSHATDARLKLWQRSSTRVENESQQQMLSTPESFNFLSVAWKGPNEADHGMDETKLSFKPLGWVVQQGSFIAHRPTYNSMTEGAITDPKMEGNNFAHRLSRRIHDLTGTEGMIRKLYEVVSGTRVLVSFALQDVSFLACLNIPHAYLLTAKS